MSDKQASVKLNEKGISLEGELVYSTVSDILRQGGRYLEEHQSASIVINLSEVNKIDSSAIAMLIGWKRLCDKENKAYQIEGAQPQAVSLITTNKMDKILSL